MMPMRSRTEPLNQQQLLASVTERPPAPLVVLGTVPVLQVVDKSRYAAGDNSLEREIQVLCKVCTMTSAWLHSGSCQHTWC